MVWCNKHNVLFLVLLTDDVPPIQVQFDSKCFLCRVDIVTMPLYIFICIPGTVYIINHLPPPHFSPGARHAT